MVIVKVNEYNSFSLFKHPSQKIVQQIHTRYSLSFRMLWWWRSQLRFIQPSIFRDHDIRAPNGRYYDSLKLLHQEFDSIFFFLSCHPTQAIECISLPPHFFWLEKQKMLLNLDLDVLRRSVSWISMNRWCMAKARMNAGWLKYPFWLKFRLTICLKSIGVDNYKARKCVFHCLRYLVFAAQVIKNGKIVDYGAANHYLTEVEMFVELWSSN